MIIKVVSIEKIIKDLLDRPEITYDKGDFIHIDDSDLKESFKKLPPAKVNLLIRMINL